MPCPDDNVVAQYMEGLLAAVAVEDLERHAASCERCHWLLGAAALAASDDSATGAPTKVAGPAEPPAEGPRGVTDVSVGTELQGRYLLETFIGEGGMGKVFAATHKRLARRFAVKVLTGHRSNHAEAITRLQREAELTSRLAHPNVIEVIDFDFTPGGLPYIVMELLEGESLAQRLARGPITDLALLLEIARQICSALEAAHRCGVVHRDLKPSNIHLRETGGGLAVKVLDFGISKELTGDSSLTATVSVLGTPRYMAPEQARGESATVDQRADIFSLGSILFESLTGAPAFRGGSLYETMSKVVEAKPDLPPGWRQVPTSIRRVVLQCLARQPRGRPPSMAHLYQQLAAAFSSAGVTSPQAADPLLRPLDAGELPAGVALDAARRPRAWLLGGGLALASIAAVTLAATRWSASDGPGASSDAAAVTRGEALADAGPGERGVGAAAPARPDAAIGDLAGRAVARLAPDAGRARRPPRRRPRQRRRRAKASRHPKGFGTLSVQSRHRGNRLWAHVYLDGKKVGQTGLTLPRVAAGWHRLEVRRAGYRSSRRKVFVAPNKTTAVNFELAR